jgi:hypothetical protein
MNHPLLQLIVCRLREFFREPEVVFWVYGFPLILAVGLGFAFRDRKPEPPQVDVVDHSSAADLCQHLKEAHIDAEVLPLDDCQQRLRTGKTALFIEPADDAYRFVFDEARPESLAAHSQAEAALLRWKAGLAVGGSDLPGGGSTIDVPVSEPGNRYIDFLMPGLVGLNVMGGGLFGVGFVIVDMRVRKLLKRLLATPMRRGQFLWSVLGARLVMLLPEMAVLLLVAFLAYGVPMRGNPFLFGFTILLGAFSFCGIGLLLASRAAKTETISGLVNVVMLSGWLLSGSIFSARRFPDVVQPVIQALPLTQFNEALRSIMLEGKSLTDAGVAWRLAALAAWGGVTFLLALRWFRWQ